MARTVNAKAAGIFLRQVDHLLKVGTVRKAARHVPVPPTSAPKASLRGRSAASTANTNWGALGRGLFGDPPKSMRRKRPHLHHIVYRKGPKGARTYTRDSQRILRKYGIDPEMDPANWIWAPNRGHTIDAARLLNQALRKADATGDPDRVVAVLRAGGAYLFGGK